jgi:hypothetical protein
MTIHHGPIEDLINVHRITADKDVILYLKNADDNFTEGLFYLAKRYGRSEFVFREEKYELVKNRDGSFKATKMVDYHLTSEAFS